MLEIQADSKSISVNEMSKVKAKEPATTQLNNDKDNNIEDNNHDMRLFTAAP